jgi:hypothetical protein
MVVAATTRVALTDRVAGRHRGGPTRSHLTERMTRRVSGVGGESHQFFRPVELARIAIERGGMTA